MTAAGKLETIFQFDFNIGKQPIGWLVEGPDGGIYGATTLNNASIFKISRDGAFTRLVPFNGTNGRGFAYLTLSRDGNFYGTAAQGGSYDYGTFFKMTPDGAFATLASFAPGDGAFPNSLIEGRDGNFFGTTRRTNVWVGAGTVFQATRTGKITVLAVFDGRNGRMPVGNLTEDDYGNLYGVTFAGGKYDSGTFFRVVKLPRLSASVLNSAMTLTWNSFPEAVYRVEYKSNLTETYWSAFPLEIVATGETVSVRQQVDGQSGRFFRVVLLP